VNAINLSLHIVVDGYELISVMIHYLLQDSITPVNEYMWKMMKNQYGIHRISIMAILGKKAGKYTL